MVQEVLQNFFLAAIISFVGSIQLGPVNLTVMHTTLNQHLKQGIFVAIGGILPEFLYAGLAVIGGVWLSKVTAIEAQLQLAVPLLLFLIGLYFLFKKRKENIQHQASGSLASGFGMGMLNPQLLPFWLMVVAYLQAENLFAQTLAGQIAFIFGTGFGAFVLLFGVAYLTDKKRAWIDRLIKVDIDKLLGIIFIFIALFQLFRYLIV